MTDIVHKLRKFHGVTPVWAAEDRAVLLAAADRITELEARLDWLLTRCGVDARWGGSVFLGTGSYGAMDKAASIAAIDKSIAAMKA